LLVDPVLEAGVAVDVLLAVEFAVTAGGRPMLVRSTVSTGSATAAAGFVR